MRHKCIDGAMRAGRSTLSAESFWLYFPTSSHFVHSVIVDSQLHGSNEVEHPTGS